MNSFKHVCNSVDRCCPTSLPCRLPIGHRGKCSSDPDNQDAADWHDTGLYADSRELPYLIEEFETPEDMLSTRYLERAIESMRLYRDQRLANEFS